MADKNLPLSIPEGQEIKIEVQGNQSETSGYCFPPSGFHSITYADVLGYVNDDKEAKMSNYSALLTGGANNLSNQYCTICKEPGHDTNLGFPINGIPIVQRPPWIPPIGLPHMPTVRQHLATVRRRRRATIRRGHMQTFGCLQMPVRVHSLQQPFIVRAPSIDRGRTVANRRQPECSRCGRAGHNIRTCGESA
ncbi:uncharacterized protein LOC133718806 isoform X2 [Rosa rugosa]|uniref:uncharacterized protein LOC133718806 isoform X2 n=1 Tax=Rosa rugosa TaxID=74645 RepID=UPI002B417C85|nr:uncharacterized protein LOC133718806 isoform X2 [Rosa rugosa]